MYYPPEIIDQVIDANNIVDVIGQYVKLNKKGSTYFGLCPFHSEKTPSFSVTDNGDKQMYYCFGCHKGGNVLTFLMKYENYTYPEAVEELAKRAGIILPKPDYKDSKERELKAKKIEGIFHANRLSAVYFSELLKEDHGSLAYRYLKDRGLNDETIDAFMLGYADKYSDDLYKFLRSKNITDELITEAHLATIKEKGTYDFFWNRVMFPIIDERERVAGFSGRVLGDGEPKYLNTPETICFKKNNLIYGLNIAKKSKEDYFILCEGNMDVISLHQAGFTNAVASLGTALTVDHAKKLKRYKSKIYISYDGDGAGLNAALRAIPRLKEAGLIVKVVDLSPYKDPDELVGSKGADEYRFRLKKAINSLFFEIFMLKKSFDMKDPDDVSKFQNETANRLSMIEDEFERENYIKAISKMFDIPYDLLKSRVRELSLSRDKVEHIRPVITERSRRTDKNDNNAIDQCMSMLLSYLAANPDSYEKIKHVISYEDFRTEPYESIAKALFAQLEDGKVNIMSIVNMFEDVDEQESVTDKLSRDLSDMDKADAGHALDESIVRIKQNSIDEKLKDLDDTAKMVELFKEKQEISGLHIFGGN